MTREDPRLAEARAIPLLDVWERLGAPTPLKPAGVERVGPCPVCGGRDRFGINPVAGVWLCRRCDAGGDGVALVRHVQGCGFLEALDFLCGGRAAEIDPAEAARRRARAADEERRREAEAARYRARAIDEARAIWARSLPGEGTAADDYLRLRRCRPALWPAALRFDPAAEYRREGRVLHVGPAMVAAVASASAGITAVHRTWIDLSQPKGKARILGPDGAAQPAKLVRGAKAAGAIRLVNSPAMKVRGAGALVVGEGIETVLTAAARGLPSAEASFWAAIDLGHLAGRMVKVPGAMWSGQPDLSDEAAFRAPRAVSELWLLRDGDSRKSETLAKLTACARRARARSPGLIVRMVDPGDGRDLNDLAMEGAE